MLRSKLFVELGLAAALALATPLLAQKGHDDAPAPAPAPSAPAAAPAQPADNKGVDPASSQPADNKGVDTKPDDKGVDTKPNDKGVDTHPDDKGVDTHPDDKGVDTHDEDVKKVDLIPSEPGESLHCKGQVEIRVQSQVEHPRETFRVQMEAQVEDGTVFVAWVNGKPAVAMTVRNGHAELQLQNEPGRAQPAGVFPVKEIKNVSVMSNTGVLVLKQDF